MGMNYGKSAFITAWLFSTWLPTAADAATADWLIDGSSCKASVVTNRNGLVLGNGLVRRSFRLAPNAATVALDNLATGHSLLRSVRPEAVVELNGRAYEVGGLAGQPIHNYLLPEWLEQMSARPGAFRFAGYETGPTQARFPWKKRAEWLSQDQPWPPPGVALTLRFEPPDGFDAVDRTRQELFADEFQTLAADWQVRLSARHERTSFQNEGKAGQISAYDNTHAYAERPLPTGARVVQCRINPGTDRGASWGPGVGLVYPDRVVKLQLRPGQDCFGIGDGGAVQQVGKLAEGQAYTLQLRIEPGLVVCEASLDEVKWQVLGEVKVAGQPSAVRVGKMSQAGGAEDHPDNGSFNRCKVLKVRILGKVETPRENLGAGDRVVIEVHYELYDGLPLLAKWFTLKNASGKAVRLNSFKSEILAAVEPESSVENNPRWDWPLIHVETDYAFGGMDVKGASPAVFWEPDPLYLTQVNYLRQTPNLLECRPPLGPDQVIPPGGRFESFRTFELLLDSTDRERQGLSRRRMYRAIAPWSAENPILFHAARSDDAYVRGAIDQCAEAGFEMVIMTFGSGFNFESRNPDYRQRFKALADYGRTQGVALGGYSLLASRGAAKAEDNCVGKSRYGVMPCLGATWGREYLETLKSFMAETGLAVLENDGSYPGDTCASTNHPGHQGLEDSQWVQWRAITGYYEWCRGQGVYLNIPDWYYLTGGSKCGMGYREENWSLPRAQQEIVERQNIYDGTWNKTASMGWMFVPLMQYHGGGAAATIEPLKDHLDHYETRLANLFGAGVQACYRGPRIFDGEATKAVVTRWVGFYKKYRAILDSDIIHGPRPDGRNLDWILHVNPRLKEKGLLMVHNPLNQPVQTVLEVPLYYTGLSALASVRQQEDTPATYLIDRQWRIQLPVQVPARNRVWFVIE